MARGTPRRSDSQQATAQRAFSGGILSPGMYSRLDIPKWQSGLKDALNTVLKAQGGIINRGGTKIATGFDNSTVDGHPWLIPFEFSSDDSYQLEFADNVMRVIREGAYVLDSTIGGQSVVGVTTAVPARIEMASGAVAANFTVGRLVYLTDPNGDHTFHTAVMKVTAISGEFITVEIAGGATVDTTTGDWGTIGSGALLYEVYQVTSPYAIEDLPRLYPTQDVDTLFLVAPGYDPQKLVRGTSDDDWTFSALTFAPEIGAPTGLSVVATTGTGTDTYNYVVTAISEAGEESLPSTEDSITNDLSTAGNKNTLTWTAATGAVQYNVYKEFNGIFGFIGTTLELTFIDENITPDTAENPPTDRNPFSATTSKPTIVTFVENRLTFSGMPDNPQAVEMSSSVSPFNFNRALTPGASDAISFRMRAQKLNRVEHVVPLDQPIILTAGAEWVLTTQEDAAIQPANFRLRPRTYRGSSSVRPIIIGETLLHVLRDGNTIREFSLASGRERVSADVTLLARDLFRGKTITSIAYAQSPDSVVWVTFADGTCLSMTYLEEHEIWGWTRHAFGGADVKVKQVSVTREGAYDVPYFVVERTLQGGPVTLVERLDDREFTDVTDAYFTDCGFCYNGAATTTLRGLLHLRGEAVSVLADGNVLEGLVVSDEGTLTMPDTATKVSVGLQYEAFIVSLPSDFGDGVRGSGSPLAEYRAPSEVTLRIVNTRGIAVGMEDGFLNEIKQFEGDEPIPLETATVVVGIEGEWERDASIKVLQAYPLPMEITAMVPEWTIGG